MGRKKHDLGAYLKSNLTWNMDSDGKVKKAVQTHY